MRDISGRELLRVFKTTGAEKHLVVAATKAEGVAVLVKSGLVVPGTEVSLVGIKNMGYAGKPRVLKL